METNKADLNSLKIDRTEVKRPPDRNKKIITRLVIGLVILIAAFLAYRYINSLLYKKEEVRLTEVKFQTGSYSSAILNASGYVVAQRKAAVASKGTGKLIYLGVVEGDQVRKNQIIARLEDNDIRAQFEPEEDRWDDERIERRLREWEERDR